jgi:hypothetical protein
MKTITRRGNVVAIRAEPHDPIARLRKRVPDLSKQVASEQQLSNADRDLLLIAIAQKLGLIHPNQRSETLLPAAPIAIDALQNQQMPVDHLGSKTIPARQRSGLPDTLP